MRLKDKVCVITGAGKGIGRKGAELFAKEGAFVYILEFDDVSGQDAENTITSIMPSFSSAMTSNAAFTDS